MTFPDGHTAVIIPVPAVEPVVSRWRAKFDPAAAAGVPAHLTVLYPFLDAARLTSVVVRDLSDLVAEHPAFDVTYSRCGTFPHVLYLVPDPDEPLRRLTQALADRWPEAPPYGGAIAEPTPHLTITLTASPDEMAQAEVDVTARLPITTTVDRAELIAFDGAAWCVRAALPLRS